MSEAEQAQVLETMAKMPNEDQRYLLGVMAGLVAKQERRQEEAAKGGANDALD